MDIKIVLDCEHKILISKDDMVNLKELYFLGEHILIKDDIHISFYLINQNQKSSLNINDSDYSWIPINNYYGKLYDEITSSNLYDSYCMVVLKGYFPKNKDYQVWSFGDNKQLTNELLDLVLSGKKTGTAGSVIGFEYFNEGIPKVGDISIITNWEGIPKCVIETTNMSIVPFSEVTAEFAKTEGEGDLSLDYWREAHWLYFSREAEKTGIEPSLSMLVACENFKVLHIFK